MITVLDRLAALEIADELGQVFAAAFGAPGYDDERADSARFAGEQLPTHADRDDFRLVAARVGGNVVGFAYGFTGQLGQWWPDRVAAAIGPELTAEWIGGHFEVVELAVLPGAQGRGVGTALMEELMRDLPHRRALLTTYVDDRPAPRLYRRLGWQVLVPDLGWGSALYGLDRGVRVDRAPGKVWPMTSERIYVGSYTSQDGGGDGIALGPLDGIGMVATVADPSFLVRSADGRFLYATNEEQDGKVSAFAIQPDGGLELLNQQPTGGAHPCHLDIDPSGRYLLSANYTSGSVAVHPIGADGSLGESAYFVQRSGTGPNADRQEGPHAHQVAFDPAGAYVFDVDLGSDTVYSSTLADDGSLQEVDRLRIHPGAGPRHLVFHPTAGAAYVINELDSTLTVCSYADGKLQIVQTASTRPADSPGENFPAELLISADGRFLYGSNRGDNTIAVFAIAADGLSVELAQTIGSGGDWPRHLAFSNDGTQVYAANERSDQIATFTIAADGRLTQTDDTVSWPKPVCILPA
ncbi:GNAT family N-acetyltransferase [Kribbella shirazensis]|uniref:6-phosphogluconolactonase (Cycloisomerase 2 family)/ribosomal protein S18 acetylase RimI-like enzyme n=1 Tax=Kribbella shirazensis TaxID=1105143 RepID=A0A7X6A0Q2_9ACTN|nr:6-phosphogluconolactonase (cycloisomerase 2 family)/ribosomal protein S18 acetylase RimI-like enzyme [Kribbella shirazensis]